MFPLGYGLGGLPAPREAIKRDNVLTPSRACVASMLVVGTYRSVWVYGHAVSGERGAASRECVSGVCRQVLHAAWPGAWELARRTRSHGTQHSTHTTPHPSLLTHQARARTAHSLAPHCHTDGVHNQGDVYDVPTAYDDQLRYCEIIFNKMFNLSTDFK